MPKVRIGMLRARRVERGVVEVARLAQADGHAVGEHARADAVGAHAEAALLHRQRPHQRLDGALRGHRQRVARGVTAPAGAGDRDDAAAVARRCGTAGCTTS